MREFLTAGIVMVIVNMLGVGLGGETYLYIFMPAVVVGVIVFSVVVLHERIEAVEKKVEALLAERE